MRIVASRLWDSREADMRYVIAAHDLDVNDRETLVALLRYLGGTPVPHWSQDAAAARLLAGAVDNDHV